MTNSITDTLVEFDDDLDGVVNFIYEHTGGNEAITTHTLAEGLMPVLARKLGLDLRLKTDADRAYHVGKLVAKKLIAARQRH